MNLINFVRYINGEITNKLTLNVLSIYIIYAMYLYVF